MKKILCLLICLFLASIVFSQNVPMDIILSYQSELELWISQNNIHIEPRMLTYGGMDLFRRPYINPIHPERKVFGMGGSVIDCFALGRFLSVAETESLYSAVYARISHDERQVFIPFRSLENFKQSLIFNPNMLFSQPSNVGLNSDFTGDYAYLIFYFGSYIERFPDTVFNLQLSQLKNGKGVMMLIFPYSFYYALFKIDDLGNIELVSYYGIN